MYTVDVYKDDKRSKRGKRFITKVDTQLSTPESAIEEAKKSHKGDKYHFSAHKTYVTRKNIMSGKEYQERYDTPVYCSPSAESYWSM